MDWQLYSFIVRSKLRRNILTCLKTAKTPTQIGKDVDSSVSNVSRTLKEFNEKGIAECVTPDQKMGRIYKLTPVGEELLHHYVKAGT